MSVFIDTSALLAVLDADDTNQQLAASAWARLLAAGEELVTSNYVVVEAIAVTQRRLGLDAVRSLVEDMLPAVPVEWVDSTAHQVGLASMLSAAQCHLSLVDCVSFELLRSFHLRRVFGFDPRFQRQGFECLT